MHLKEISIQKTGLQIAYKEIEAVTLLLHYYYIIIKKSTSITVNTQK